MNETIIDVLLGVLIFLTIANQFAAHKAKKAGDELRRWAEERDSSAKLYEDQCIAQQQLIDNLYERLALIFTHFNQHYQHIVK